MLINYRINRQISPYLIFLTIILLGCGRQELEKRPPVAISNKNAIVFSTKTGGDRFSDTLIWELFPDLSIDLEQLDARGLSNGGEWLIGMQYLREYGWLPTFVRSVAREKVDLSEIWKKQVGEYSIIRSVPLFQLNDSLFAASTEGVLIVGRIPLLVEDAIRQLKGGRENLGRLPFFRDQWRGHDIFLFPPEFRPSTATPFSLSGMFKKYQSLALNFESQADKIIMTGKALPVVGENNRQWPEKSISGFALELLPENMIALKWIAEASEELSKSYQEYFSSWWKGELALVQLEGQASPVFIFKSSNAEETSLRLDALAAKQGVLEEHNYQVFHIRRLWDNQLLSPWSSEPVRNPYFIQIGDYALFSASYASLTLCADYYLSGRPSHKARTIPEELPPAYRSLTHLQLDKLVNPDAALSSLAGFLTFVEFFEENETTVWGVAKRSREREASLNLFWSRALNGTLRLGPACVRDALGNSLAYIAQDSRGELFLLDPLGNILWRRLLKESTISRFFNITIDGREVLFFNSAQNLFAINMKGEDLANFPLKLAAPAAAGMQLIDFDQVGRPSIFIPTSDGRVYGYDYLGEMLSGWNPKQDTLPLLFPIQHFQENYEDFLFGFNELDSLLVWGRDGRFRESAFKMDTLCLSPPQVQNTGPKRIVAIDILGRAKVLTSQGEQFKLNFPPGEGRRLRWAYADVRGDGRYEYILLNESDLAVYSYEEQRLELSFTYRFATPQDTLFTLSDGRSDKAFIGTLNRERKRLYLLDGSGKLLDGFPVAASTPGVLTHTNREGYVLLVGLDNKLAAYKINNE